MEGLATYWQQADTVGRAVGLMLLLMSVSTWAVIFWKAWMLTRARRDLAVGTSAFWRAADLASARSALQTLDRDGVLLPLVEAVQALPGNAGMPIVLIGTSAGGLATLLATERVTPLALWVGLDPVDAFRLSKSAAGRLQAPSLVLRGRAGACNVGGSARRIAGWLPEGRIEQRIDGASHCDFENPTDSRCETICGDADPARQEQIVQITVDAARRAVAGHGTVAPLSAPRP